MKDFKVINIGKENIVVDVSFRQLMPTELYLKEDGDIDNNPSIAIVMDDLVLKKRVIGQISLKMLNEGLAEIGYIFQKI